MAQEEMKYDSRQWSRLIYVKCCESWCQLEREALWQEEYSKVTIRRISSGIIITINMAYVLWRVFMRKYSKVRMGIRNLPVSFFFFSFFLKNFIILLSAIFFFHSERNLIRLAFLVLFFSISKGSFVSRLIKRDWTWELLFPLILGEVFFFFFIVI